MLFDKKRKTDKVTEVTTKETKKVKVTDYKLYMCTHDANYYSKSDLSMTFTSDEERKKTFDQLSAHLGQNFVVVFKNGSVNLEHYCKIELSESYHEQEVEVSENVVMSF